MSALSFKERVRTGELLAGPFVKTTSHQAVEIVGAAGFDFMVVDAEHAPFDRHHLDLAALAARSTGTPALVRVPESTAREILNALDLGFDGVLAPHALSGEGAEQVARASRYRNGARGISNSPRAGGYGTATIAEHIARSDREATVICQIEDLAAIQALPELVAATDVDAYLIGRADLAVSCGVDDIRHPSVQRAVDHTVQACLAAHKTVGIFVGNPDEIPLWADAGVRLFIVGSDQAMLRAHAVAVAKRVADIRQGSRTHA